jgi:hypothetical protein
MNSIGNFPKCVISVAKPKNIDFALTYVWEIFALFSGDFFMDLYSVDSDEALNASSLQFLSIAKRFIASSLQFFSQC